MTEIPISQEAEANQECLSDIMYELSSIERLLLAYERNGEHLDTIDIFLLLTRTVIAKLDYYQSKYDFKVDEDDRFYVEDMLEFAKKKASADVKRRKFLKSRGLTGGEV